MWLMMMIGLNLDSSDTIMLYPYSIAHFGLQDFDEGMMEWRFS